MKKVCPVCRKKINKNEELCPKCGYFFSDNNYNVDYLGHPYDNYQEENHQEHYEYNKNIAEVQPTEIISDEDENSIRSTDNKNVFSQRRYTDIELIDLIKEVLALTQKSLGGIIIGTILLLIAGCLIISGFTAGGDGSLPIGIGIFLIIFGVTMIRGSVLHKKISIIAENYFARYDFTGYVNYVESLEYKMSNNLHYCIALLISYYYLKDKNLTLKYVERIAGNTYYSDNFKNIFHSIVIDLSNQEEFKDRHLEMYLNDNYQNNYTEDENEDEDE